MDLTSIAFIPDGNRRYAAKMGISFAKAYQIGTQRAWDVLDWIAKYPSVKVGTFYTLSLENLARAKELKVLFKIFERELNKVTETDFFEKNSLRLKFIGRLNLLPKKLQEKIREAETRTGGSAKRTVNLALGYNGQAEIVDAAKRIAQDYSEKKIDLSGLDPESFKKYLYAPFPSPDLIIRTSGTHRLSGFLTYQSSYSELYFCPKYWPEFSEADLDLAVEDFNQRQRNFGK